jgi:ribosomal-protein-alanine N-acetyltransferase
MIREACKEDFQAILEIEQKTNITPWSDSMLKSSFDCNDVFVLDVACEKRVVHEKSILKQNTVQGFIIAQSVVDEAAIMHLVVDSDHQSKGYGGILLRSWLELLSSEVNQVWLEVRKSNIVAQKLYESCGFKKITERENYYRTLVPHIKETALIYCLEKRSN